jgi:hypothetical protein
MFTGRGKHPTIILEAVASFDLWIWHTYFGMPGSCNDINVLQLAKINVKLIDFQFLYNKSIMQHIIVWTCGAINISCRHIQIGQNKHIMLRSHAKNV